MTPPRDSYLVRIPVGSGVEFDSAFSALPADVRKATATVETKKGDTPASVARQHDVPASAIAAFNPSLRKLKSGRLAPGQLLVVPTPAVVAAALDIPDPGIEKYPNSTSRMKVHTVRRGESLRLIARKYDISPERLMRLNGLRKPVIFPGQTLLLASRASKARSSSARSSRSSGSTKSSAGRKKAASAKSSASRSTKNSSGAGSKAGARKKKGKSAKG
jgi:LysM repeat protein